MFESLIKSPSLSMGKNLKQRLLIAGGGFQADGGVAFRREDAALRRAGEVHGVSATSLPLRIT